MSVSFSPGARVSEQCHTCAGFSSPLAWSRRLTSRPHTTLGASSALASHRWLRRLSSLGVLKLASDAICVLAVISVGFSCSFLFPGPARYAMTPFISPPRVMFGITSVAPDLSPPSGRV